MNEQNNENKLKEGEDFYYTPEGYKCFTEKYHLKEAIAVKADAAIVHTVLIKKRGPIENKQSGYQVKNRIRIDILTSHKNSSEN